MEKAFKELVKTQFPFLGGSKFIVAVSGGVDSVVLVHLCKMAKLQFSMAHCNFNLRGEESNKDESFVIDLADVLDAEVFTESFDTATYAEEAGISIQMAARDLRYSWFDELSAALNFDYVLTAHHANDNLETFLINLIRGTGIEGLIGIPEEKERIIRPLLKFSRKEIEKYATTHHISWREDSSNISNKYMRNKIRHEIVPVLEDLNPQLLQNFEKTQFYLKESSLLVDDYLSLLYRDIVQTNDFGYELNIAFLEKTVHPKAVLYQLLKSFGFTEWDDVYHLLKAQSGKKVFSKTHRLIKDREKLLLTEIPEDKSDVSYKISENENVVMLPIGTFTFNEVDEITPTAPNRIFVAKESLIFPLTLRKWQKGDFFYPFGMKGKKKLSDFFKDRKFSLPEKENCWLLCSANKIVWVINQRADERFSVKSPSQKIIKITHNI